MVKRRRMRLAGRAARTEKMRYGYDVSVRKPEYKKPLRRPISRWEDNIKMYIREVRCEGVDWNHLAQDRDRWRALVNTVMKLSVLSVISLLVVPWI
jgi:hypothetical protein